MPIRRRDFLYWTGLGSLAFNPFVRSFGQSLHYKPGESPVKVIGILPDPNSIGPKGFHLRWLPPIQRGIPAYTHIYRNSIGEPGRTSMQDIIRMAADGCSLVVKETLKIATIDTSFLYSEKFPESKPLEKIMKDLKDEKFHNYFLPEKSGRDKALARLSNTDPKSKLSNIEYILRLAWAIHYEGGQNSNHNPALASLSTKGNEASVNALNILYYAALDPTVAKILGLYYVDEKIPQASNDVFQYTVICVYPDKKEYGGCLLPVFPNIFANLPPLFEPLSLSQLEPSKWEFDGLIDNRRLLCRTGLRWKTAPNLQYIFDGKMEKYKDRFINPALYEMKRRSQIYSPVVKNILDTRIHTTPEGKFRDPDNDNNYVDSKIPIEAKLDYELKGIDLFGQQSKVIKDGIELRNNLPPAAPVNLLVIPSTSPFHPPQPPPPERAIIEFDYGPYQYAQSPDTKNFSVYFKKGPLNTDREFTYTIININSPVNLEDGGKRYEIQFTEPVDNVGGVLTNPTRFPFHTIHFIKDIAGNNLPAAKKRTLIIQSFRSGNTIFAMGEEELDGTPATGKAILKRDILIPMNNNDPFYSWQKVNDRKYLIPPVTFTINQSNGYSPIPSDTSRMFRAVCKKAITFTEPEDRSSLSATSRNMMILFIDRPFHEPGVFTGGKLKVDSSSYDIAFQSSGKKAGINFENLYNNLLSDPEAAEEFKNGFAQIWVRIGGDGLSESSFNNKVIFLTQKPAALPPEGELNQLQGLVQLRMQRSGSFNSDLYSKGDLLFSASIRVHRILNAGSGSEQKIIQPKEIRSTGKLLSDIYSYNGNYYALVKLNRNVHAINNNNSAFFPRYGGDLAFDVSSVLQQNPLASTDAKQNIFFAIAAEKTDTLSLKKISSLSQPVHYTQIRNTKPPAPARPYPCNSTFESNNPGYVSFPDAKGMSSFKLCWDHDGSGDRFEVARASLQTIITEHHKLWLAGISAASTIGSPIPSPIDGIHFSSFQNIKGGILEATTNNNSAIDERYLNGRIFNSNNYFQLIKIISSSGQLKLWLKVARPGSVFTSSPGYRLEAISNYSSVMDNETLIRDTASVCPNAFGIVTGTPLRAKVFTDFIPGKGTGKYYYILRVVDAAENVSPWSPASVAIYQLDTNAPPVPLEFSVEPGDRVTRLYWKAFRLNESIEGFEIFRFENEPNDSLVYGSNTRYQLLPPTNLQFKKITLKQGSLQIPDIISFPVPSGTGNVNERISQFLSSRSIIVHTGNNINLFDRTLYDVKFEMSSNASTFRLTRITQKTLAVPATHPPPVLIPQETPLTLIIEGVEMREDKRYWCYEDTAVEFGKKYFYGIRIVKRIRSINKQISGKVTPLVKVYGLDLSIPVAPQILSGSWKNSDGTPVSIPTNQSVYSIRIRSQSPVTKYSVQRRKKGLMVWQPLSAELWQEWGNAEVKDINDPGAMGISDWEYNIQFIGRNNNKSPFTIFQIQ